MLLAVAAACAGETVEVPGETVVVEKVVTETVEVPGETVVVEKEVIRTVEVPGETVTKEVVKEVMVPGETVVVKEEVVKTVEVPGETVTVEVVKEVQVPGETVVVEKEVVKTVEVPGETVVVTKEVAVPVEVVREVPTGKNYVTDPTTGKTVPAPQYGGTFTWIRRVQSATIDPAAGATIPTRGAGDTIGFVNEKMGIGDWALDRDKFDFTTIYVPVFVLKGLLAESWEQPDPLTYIFHLRKGIQYHDKPPVNGRELTADDVVYSFHRVLGIGSGFTELGGIDVSASLGSVPIESITASDKNTVVFKLTKPFLPTVPYLLVGSHTLILPPEVIKEHGDYKDWRNVVGTGPYELVDSVEDTSFTWRKNPNYWGFDEKYPENRLPYIDKIKVLLMPEEATRVAAMRAGKADYVGWIGETHLFSIDVMNSLQKTNPELNLHPQSYRAYTFALNVQMQPFDDIKVRKAVSMALDLETINNTLYRGWGDPTPSGWIGKNVIGYRVEPEDWPEEVKEGYRYDPEGAEKLLDEAGYPRGADGVRFKTVMAHYDKWDLDYITLLMGNLRKIGIEVEIQVYDIGIWNAGRRAHEWEMFNDNTNFDLDPLVLLNHSYSGSGPGSMSWNFGNVQDAEYNALVEAAVAATTLEEQQRAVREAEMYKTSQYWVTRAVRAPFFSVTQPWVVGYNGEGVLGTGLDRMPIFARLWIDSELKEAMGH